MFEFKPNADLLEAVVNSEIYKNWETTILSNFNTRKIIVHNVFMFGSRVGFIIVEAEAYRKDTGTKVPGIAFLRGDCVSIMPVIKCNGKIYTAVVSEARTPIGESNYMALPAGMVDGMAGGCAAIKELKEEIGPEFDVTDSDLVYMGRYSVSGGGSDEHMEFFYFEKEISEEVLNKLNGKVTGNSSENEYIKVSIIDIDTLPKVTQDMRSVFSYMMWKNK